MIHLESKILGALNSWSSHNHRLVDLGEIMRANIQIPNIKFIPLVTQQETCSENGF